MDLTTLMALYPLATEVLGKAPQVRQWMERKARREEPAFLLQMQVLEAIGELKQSTADSVGELRKSTTESVRELRESTREWVEGLRESTREWVEGLRKSNAESIGELRAYTLTTAIMTAMLSNPELTPQQLKEKFIASGDLARDIISTVRHITP